MIPNSEHTNTYTKIYLCPSTPKGSCLWEGDAADILEHFQDSHKDLLMDSNTIKADVTQDSEQNRLIALEKGLFLVQTKVSAERAKLWIRLRFLASEELVSKMRYSVEVSTGKFGFTNENPSSEFNPVHNAENGIEVDIQAIKVIENVRTIDNLNVKINITESTENNPIKDVTDEISSPNMNYPKINSEAFEKGQDSDQRNSLIDDGQHSVNQSSSCEYLQDTEESYDETDDYLNLAIKCPTCDCNMIPPIFMCPLGHSVCYNCKDQTCSICGQKITELRNTDLEEHSKTLDYPCRYEPQGCSEKYKYNEIRKHEIYCDYCIYKCELCPREGRFDYIRTHFRIAHPSTKIYETMSGLRFPKGSNFVIMNSNGVFYCSSCATETNIEWKVVFCGPKERCYSCEVRITRKKQNNLIKRYFLKRHGNVFKLCVSFDQLKSANVKEKNSYLYISSYP